MNEDIANEMVIDPASDENAMLEQPVASSQGHSTKDLGSVDLSKNLKSNQLVSNLPTKKNSFSYQAV